MPRSVQTILVALLFIEGCAAINKGSRTSVLLDVPPETELRNHTEFDAELATSHDSLRQLRLTSGENYLLEYQSGVYRDSVVLHRKLEDTYIGADILCVPILGFGLVGLSIDLSGPGYRFDTSTVAFPPHPHIDADSSRPTLNVYLSGEARRPIGLIVMLHTGVKYPFNQALLWGNNNGVGLGYHIVPEVALMGYYGGSTMMDFARAGSNLYMEATMTTYALEGRVYPWPFVYGSIGIEHIDISADSLRLTDTTPWGRTSGFSQRMMGASVGAGVTLFGIFIEWRQHWGFDEVQLPGGLRQPVSNPAIRFGINAEF